jgi:hypothetical protein
MRKLLSISAVIIFGLMLYSCVVPSDTTNRRKLETQFQDEFGFSPPSATATLRGRTVTVGDSWTRWLQFRLDEASLRRLLTNGFSQTNSDVLTTPPWAELWTQNLVSHGPNEPKWWRLPANQQVRIFYRKGHARDYAGFTFVWVDDTNRTAYAQSSAWH